ncbi:MAG: hypothetical protein LBO72_10910 [Helicobacteraceae bacterium]|jgi:hypothetical protein|nr:hypothetical protein [Helicobacteraceae bacterium]
MKRKAVVAALAALALVLGLAIGFSGCESKSDAKSSASAGDDIPSGYTKEGGEIVNGFVLPPYPDPKINDSTLLGIDSNNNGVRDDVKRWLIFKYKDDHRIVTHIGFQIGRAHQFMLANPNKPEEARKLINGAQACNWYFKYDADEFGEPILIDHSIATSTAFKTAQLNTKARIKAFFAYDKKLSGGVYRLPDLDDQKALCDFDVDALLKEQK